MKWKKNIYTLLLIYCSTLLSGCWNYTEVEERFIITAVGIDCVEGEEMYKVTMKAVNAKPTSGGIELVPVVLAGKGKSIFEAIRKCAVLYGRKLYWSHLQSIILNESIAEENVFKALDFFYRDAEVRQDNILFISSGSSAEEMVRLESDLQSERYFTLRYAVKTERFTGTFPRVDLMDFFSESLEESFEPILPIVRVTHDMDKNGIKIEGAAVIRNHKKIGELSPYETLMVLIVKNKIENPLLIIPINDSKNVIDNKVVTMEVFNSKTKIRSNTDDKNVSISLSIEMDASIAEMNYSMNYLDEDSIKELQNLLQSDIEQRISKTIKSVQQNYSSDIFGFGKQIEIDNSKAWNSIKDNWDEKFKEVPVSIEVIANIRSTGKVTKLSGE
ncbi:Ger(x)C family spore germination protein [Clostridium swellfunianum]|uniref:Ger(x)C family spore germination protein n=1 Tax=Clostridium swellfunianum TaxID=1367462 RepID=UPI00202FF5C2|nr:Ger(x)C family spore germination protein [Clostridium swellfunianum]MCM0646905.1 Ger(x)C family spore germination protein [Clostridium swellfunianum]